MQAVVYLLLVFFFKLPPKFKDGLFILTFKRFGFFKSLCITLGESFPKSLVSEFRQGFIQRLSFGKESKAYEARHETHRDRNNTDDKIKQHGHSLTLTKTQRLQLAIIKPVPL